MVVAKHLPQKFNDGGKDPNVGPTIAKMDNKHTQRHSKELQRGPATLEGPRIAVNSWGNDRRPQRPRHETRAVVLQ